MNQSTEGNAIIYCENAFNTQKGKIANSLARFTARYKVISIVDSKYAGQDAGQVLDNKANNIHIFSTLKEAYTASMSSKLKPTHLVIGLSTDDEKLSEPIKEAIKYAIKKNLNIDSGLHEFASDEKELKTLAAQHNVKIRDFRKTPLCENLHLFTGKIEEVNSFTIAVLGTDSSVGKRTTARLLSNALRIAGYKSEFIGTGVTSWMQGAKYSIVLDSLINSFVSGEIEHVIHTAWKNEKPNFIIIEGHGSLLNPAHPGGFELLSAGRPDIIILQHAPGRKDYLGFPDYRIQPISRQIKAIELISNKQVVAVTLNHENMTEKDILKVSDEYAKLYEIPAMDVLHHGIDKLVKVVLKYKK